MLDKVDDDLCSTDIDSDDFTEEIMKIDSYKEILVKNPLDYDCHLKLIKALKYDSRFNEAREAREQMNRFYPLSPEIWIDWIDDEISNNNDKDYINKLFIRATEDYRSADVWYKYCQFIIGYMQDKNEIRQIFEKALSQVGTHCSSGYLIWGTLICYENALLSIYRNDQSMDINEQRERIYKLYSRQLSIPLQGNDETLDEFLKWNNGYAAWEDEIRSKYKKSQELLEKYLVFEENISDSTAEYEANNPDSDSKEQHWLKYLQYAHENMSKSEIINLYERAVTELCLSQKIWTQYLQYISKNFERDQDRILAVYKRAVRNYTSSLKIWLGLTRYMEMFNYPVVEIRSTFESIFQQNLIDENPFVPLWRAYLSFERRQIDEESVDLTIIRSLFKRLEGFDNYVYYDPQCGLLKYWAFIEAKYGKNMTKSRELWSQIRKNLGNQSSLSWLEQLEFERKYGDFDHLKRLAGSALNCFTDYAEYLFDGITRMFDEDGDLKSCIHIARKIEVQRGKIEERRLRDEENDTKTRKRKLSQTIESKSKRAKPIATPESKPESVEKKVELKPKSTETPMQTKPVEKCNEKSIYISNLSYNVTENDLREKFASCGLVTDVRIAKDSSGKSRGFAYVQFESEKNVNDALLLERAMLHDRPMFVSRNDPDKRHSFQYTVGVAEKTKLFVKNLPKTVTKHALETMFGAYGTVQDVRIVTFKDGTPKGIAYIQFTNEDDASKALVATDGVLVGDRAIEVFISQPPPKSGSNFDRLSIEPVAPSTSFIIPRAIRKPMVTQKKLIHASRPVEASTTDQADSTPKKSNDDFRKFLL